MSTITSSSATLLNIGRVAGLVGTVMYALNLLYATRLRFLEYFFGGLNRVYIAHHLLGGLALVMLSLHPLLLALRYVVPDPSGASHIKLAALLLVPNGIFPIAALFDQQHIYYQGVLQQWAIFFGIIAFWGMVLLLLVTFFIKLPYRLWLLTHKFLGVAFVISALHILFISSDTTNDMLLKTYMLTMISIGTAAFIYKSILGKILIRRYRYTVETVKTVAGNVVQIGLSPKGKVMQYKPGQFIFIRFLHGSKVSREWHPFSISSAPADRQLQLSIKGLGDYTNKLTDLTPGTTAEIEGAYGRFSYTNYNNKHQIWIAGGIGVTPFLSMVKELKGHDVTVDLYYSVKTKSELIDWDVLYGEEQLLPDTFRVIPYVADQQQGFLDANYIEKMSGGLDGKDIYICGPPPMMQSLRKQFKAKGVPGTNIHSEEFAMS